MLRSRNTLNSYSASCGNVCANDSPPRVPSGSPSTCSSCESSGGTRKASRITSLSVPTGQAAHLARRPEILLEERRRNAQHAGDVVEAEALVVRRQQARPVDLQVEQVADGVAVLGAISNGAGACGPVLAVRRS
jgi:hypothetical protein